MPSRVDKRLLASLDEFEHALGEVSQAADAVRAVVGRFRTSLQEGLSVTGALERSLPTPNLPRLAMAVKRAQAAQKKARGLLLLSGRDKGESVVEMTRLLGVSRQLGYESIAGVERDDR
jgi:hypothetical protein